MRMDDTDQNTALETLKRYNAAVRDDIPFNPNVKDGRRTEGLEINKSNWANTLDTPPFEAYAVTCGITFTFGGLRINNDAQVMSSDAVSPRRRPSSPVTTAPSSGRNTMATSMPLP